MAHFKIVRGVLDALKYGSSIGSWVLVADLKDAKEYAVRESVKHQVLCEATAFLCIGKELVDGKYQQYLSSQVQKVQIPQPQPVYRILPGKHGAAKLIPVESLSINSPKKQKSKVQETKMLIQKQLQQLANVNDMMMNRSLEEDEQYQHGLMGILRSNKKKKRQPAQYKEQGETKVQMTPQLKQQLKPVAHPSAVVFTVNQIEADLKAMIEKQRTDGHWDQSLLAAILILLSIAEDDLKAYRKYSRQFIATLLMTTYISRLKNNPEYVLLSKKGDSWIKKHAQVCSIPAQDIQAIKILVKI